MTCTITCITAREPDRMLRAAMAALGRGSQLVELRLDALDEPAAGVSRIASKLPAGKWIATLRPTGQGGSSELPDDVRAELLDRCAQAGAGWVDCERTAIGAMGVRLLQHTDTGPCGVIVSDHFFDGDPRDYRDVVDRMAVDAPGAVVKVAWAIDDAAENLTALDICRSAPGRRVAVCMGEKGLMSRVLAKKCQSFGTYCADLDGHATAPGQITLSALGDLYGFDRQTAGTKVYGVIGSPVAHSLSPLVFNAQFQRDGVDAVYLPIRIDDADELTRFLDGCRDADWLDASGFSVTLPHKHSALAWADWCDPLARRIGAANTLKRDAGLWRALNTDYGGLIDAVAAGLRTDAGAIGRMRAVVLGAGGVARAAVAGLCDQGCDVTIYNRTAGRAEALADAFGCTFRPWSERSGLSADLIVNCTRVGLWPEVDDTPLDAAAIPPNAVVMDTVYRPVRTRLLGDARQRGCVTIDGVEMFVRQAARQYAIWQQGEMDLDNARAVVLDALAGEQTGGSS